jgi:LemA protein
LNGALGKLFALSEAYPDLKANENMIQLTEAITSTENKIAFARQGYNDAVTDYNIAIQSFPDNLIAGFGNFRNVAQLESTEKPEERQAIRVSFQ